MYSTIRFVIRFIFCGKQWFNRFEPRGQCLGSSMVRLVDIISHHLTCGSLTARTETHAQGQNIFYPGDCTKKVYFLVSGVVKLSRLLESGQEMTLAFLGQDSVFGVLPLITQQPSNRLYYAEAFTKVEVMSLVPDMVATMMREDPELPIALMQSLSSRILYTERMIEIRAYQKTASKLVHFLLILCDDFGHPGCNGITIELKITHQAIAETIGSTRTTVHRLLKEFKERKFISIHKRKITVHNPSSLGKQYQIF